MNKYTSIIGLEVHVELKTKSKMFCRCAADYFGKEPNTHTCPVCLGLPGALPVPNKKALDWCIKIALALNCKINEVSKFDRKNYFYPDLAKGYQISQYDVPFGYDGFLELGDKNSNNQQLTANRRVRIRRVHMEEDTGKLTHEAGSSLIDFNRSGVPLVEIVTEPDFHDAKDVKEYLQKLQQIVRYLNVSNADMEKGEMRLEPNISLTLTSSLRDLKENETIPSNLLPNYKVEVKNINSFRFVEKAIEFEIARQTELLEKGERPAQETRGFDNVKMKTFSQRSKEDAQDYRYFPEPDIPPITTTKEQIKNLRDSLPELPDTKINNFINLGLSPEASVVSAATIVRAKFIEDAFQYAKEQNIDPIGTVNYIINRKINDIPTLTPQKVVEDYKTQSTVRTVDESELKTIIKQVLEENMQAVADYKKGKVTVIMFLVGQVMRKVGKKIDAQMVKEKLEKTLTDK